MMRKKVSKFIALSPREKRLFLRSYLMLGRLRGAMKLASFKYLTRSLDALPHDSEPPSLTPEEEQIAQMVGKAVTTAAAHTPWESACLVQALVAQRLLQKQGVGCLLYLGAKRKDESVHAHAWVKCGEQVITGASGHEAFTILKVLGWNR